MSEQKQTPEEVIPQPQEGAPTEMTTSPLNIEKSGSKSKRKYLLASLGVLLLLSLGIFAFIQLAKDENKKNAGAKSSSAVPQEKKTLKSQPVFCAGLGVRSMQCEDLETGEHRKYELPESLGQISRFIPNKTGDKIFANGFVKQQADDMRSIEVFKIYDMKLNVVAELPSATDESGSSSLQDVNWLDTDSMVYAKREGDKRQLFSFDVKTRKESLLVETDQTIERLMPSGDRKYIYAIRGLLNKATNSIERKLVVINTDTGSIVDVARGAEKVNIQDLAYSPVTSQFYEDALMQTEQIVNLRMYKVDNVATQPKLSFISQIDRVNIVTTYAYTVTVTNKGILAQSGTDYIAKAPYRFYTATDQNKPLTLSVGAKNAFYLPLPQFPEIKAASTNKPSTRDFFRPPNGTPQAITSFVDKMVDERAGCKDGNYNTYELNKYDGEAQFALTEINCEAAGTVFYKRENGTYKEITSIREGMTCADRDKFGISKVVFPDCRQPGEGI